MKAEAVMQVRFLTTAEGGRKRAIESEKYGCPLMLDGHGFDCRFVLSDVTRFELGETYEIPVKFLNPNMALKELHEGAEISLWEGKTIAKGTLTKLL